MADEPYPTNCYSALIHLFDSLFMRPTTATRVRFFEASKDSGTYKLPPPSDKIVSELGLENDPDARIGFTGKGNVIYAKRQKSKPANSRLDHWLHRPQIRRLAADAALKRLTYSVKKKIEKGVDSHEMNARLAVIEKQIKGSATVRAADLESLFDSIANAQSPHDAMLKANAEKEEQLRLDMAVKGAARFVMENAKFDVSGLPSKVPSFGAEAACDFQAFILEACRDDDNPPNYALARAFAEEWGRAKSQDVNCDPRARHLIDSLVRLTMRGCKMEVPSVVEQPPQKFKHKGDGRFKRSDGALFKRGQLLGEGGNAKTYLYTSGDASVAIKELRADDESSRLKEAQEEAKTHNQAQVGGNHIVGIHGTVEAPGAKLIVLEYAPNGDGTMLEKRIADDPTLDKPAKSHALKTLFAGMTKGVAQAHRNGVMHLDVKPGNYFIGANGKPLLGDFGTSRAQLADFMESPIDSPDFTAPELIRGRKENTFVTERADIWSLGVILFKFTKGEMPFPFNGRTSESFDLILDFAGKGRLDRFKQLKLDPMNRLHQLIVQMLDPAPLKRPSAEAVLAHPLIAPYVN